MRQKVITFHIVWLYILYILLLVTNYYGIKADESQLNMIKKLNAEVFNYNQ